MPETKRCNTCKSTFGVDHFYKDRRKGDGLYGSCKDCHNKRTLEWVITHPKECHTKNIKSKYQMTKEEFDGLFEAQGGVCARCHQPETGISPYGNVWHLSLNRKGDVENLLCRSCLASVRNLARKLHDKNLGPYTLVMDEDL